MTLSNIAALTTVIGLLMVALIFIGVKYERDIMGKEVEISRLKLELYSCQTGRHFDRLIDSLVNDSRIKADSIIKATFQP